MNKAPIPVTCADLAPIDRAIVTDKLTDRALIHDRSEGLAIAIDGFLHDNLYSHRGIALWRIEMAHRYHETNNCHCIY